MKARRNGRTEVMEAMILRSSDVFQYAPQDAVRINGIPASCAVHSRSASEARPEARSTLAALVISNGSDCEEDGYCRQSRQVRRTLRAWILVSPVE
jgi:hypothetical protein